MDLAETMFREGEKDALTVRQAIEALINDHPHTQIDYVSLCDSTTLEDVARLGDETLLALAVKVGATRLIDNRLIREMAE